MEVYLGTDLLGLTFYSNGVDVQSGARAWGCGPEREQAWCIKMYFLEFPLQATCRDKENLKFKKKITDNYRKFLFTFNFKAIHFYKKKMW